MVAIGLGLLSDPVQSPRPGAAGLARLTIPAAPAVDLA